MALIHTPKRYALLVGLAPLSIVVIVLGFVLFLIADFVGAITVFLGQSIGAFSMPVVLTGIWLDAQLVKEHTDVDLTPWQWNIFGLFFAPLVGSLYLYQRRSWFGREK